MNWIELVSLICTVATVHGSRLPTTQRTPDLHKSLESTDCACCASGPKITDILHEENGGLVRLVIFAYQKKRTGEVTIFIPEKQYQHCIQDLPLWTGKAYKHYEDHNFDEVFKNPDDINNIIKEPVQHESHSEESEPPVSVESSDEPDVQDAGNDLASDSTEKDEEPSRVKIPYWEIPVRDFVTGKDIQNSHEGPYYFNTDSLEEQNIIPKKWIFHDPVSELPDKEITPSRMNDYPYNNQILHNGSEDGDPFHINLYLNGGNDTPVTKPEEQYDSGIISSEDDRSASSGEIIYNYNDDQILQNSSDRKFSEDDNSSQFDVYLNEANHFPTIRPHVLGLLGKVNLQRKLEIQPSGGNRPSIFNHFLNGNSPSGAALTNYGIKHYPQIGLGISTPLNIIGHRVDKSLDLEIEAEESQESGATDIGNIEIPQKQDVPSSSESNSDSLKSQIHNNVDLNHLMFPMSNEYEYTLGSSETVNDSNDDTENDSNSAQTPLYLHEQIEESSSVERDSQGVPYEESSEESTEYKTLQSQGPTKSRIHPIVQEVLEKSLGESINRMVPFRNKHGLHSFISNPNMNFIKTNPFKNTFRENGYRSPYPRRYKSPKDVSFNYWFQKQMKGIKDNGTEMPTKPGVIKSVKLAIGKTLKKNGLWVSKDGKLHSANGRVYSLSNLKLQPLLIGRSVPYNHLIKTRGKYKVPPRTPFIEGLLISMLRPTKVLGIVPLGITSLSRRFNPNGEYMLQIEKRKLDAGAQKALSQILPSRRSTSTLAVMSPNNDLNHLWQSVSDILKRGGTTVTRVTGSLIGKQGKAVRWHNHGLDGHVHKDGEDTSESDNGEVLPSFRIIGGNYATGTGTPIASKGRSGLD